MWQKEKKSVCGRQLCSSSSSPLSGSSSRRINTGALFVLANNLERHTQQKSLSPSFCLFFSLQKHRMQSSARLNGSPRPRLHTQSDSINRLRGQAHLTQKCKRKQTDIFMGFSRCVNTFCLSVQAYRFDSDNKSLFDL